MPALDILGERRHPPEEMHKKGGKPRRSAMSPRRDPTQLGQQDERINRAAERHDAADAAEAMGPPLHDESQPTARPPPSATTEPEPAGRTDIEDEP